MSEWLQVHQETLRLLRDQLAAVASEARSREITRDHSRSLVGGSHSAECCAAAPPSPRRVPCHAGRARGACYPRRSGGDCRCARAGEEEVMAERARAAARVRVGRRSGGQRGPRRRQLGAGGGGGADWVACCLSDGRAPVARYHARGCDCEPLRRASCLLCGSFLSFHIRFGPVRSTTHERCEAQRREKRRAEPRKRSA